MFKWLGGLVDSNERELKRLQPQSLCVHLAEGRDMSVAVPARKRKWAALSVTLEKLRWDSLEALDGKGQVIGIVENEETGGLDGAARVAAWLKQQRISPRVIFDEWSGVFDGELFKVKQPVALVAVAEKGYMTVRLTVRGEAGHASRPARNGVIERLSSAVTRLGKKPVRAAYREPVRSMFTTLAHHT